MPHLIIFRVRVPPLSCDSATVGLVDASNSDYGEPIGVFVFISSGEKCALF